MTLIDTHCHLNDPSFGPSTGDVIDRAEAVGVSAFIVPAYDARSLERTSLLASSYPGRVFPAYGLHPWYVAGSTNWGRLAALLREDRTVAVGEIGLDFSPGCPPPETQEEVFLRQVDMARERGLPVIVHCRKSHERTHDILSRYRGTVRGVMHSFSGSREMMERFLDLGFFISFSGSVTRERAKRYHRNARIVPAERFLLETDAPSIATESTVASAVEPRHTVEVAEKMAGLRATPFDEICAESTRNARLLFDLP